MPRPAVCLLVHPTRQGELEDPLINYAPRRLGGDIRAEFRRDVQLNVPTGVNETPWTDDCKLSTVN